MIYKKWLPKILALLVILINLSSCTFKDIEFKKIESFKLLKTEKNSATAELYILLRNPNKTSITVTGLDMNVTINQTNIGKVKLQEKVKLKGNSEEAHRFVIKANYGDLAVGGFSSILSMVFSKKINIKGSGQVKARVMGVSKTLPVEINNDVPISYFTK
ncbi:MAG: LEA type 2 family protein [Bacteroidia bacterium]|nr:LEA type 2 family protein [Bacteroidia bacterium]MCZ2249831.1 LEA type 2 family protein [Bacteroidia bacterium]